MDAVDRDTKIVGLDRKLVDWKGRWWMTEGNGEEPSMNIVATPK